MALLSQYRVEWLKERGYIGLPEACIEFWEEQRRLRVEEEQRWTPYFYKKLFGLVPPQGAVRGNLDKDEIKGRADIVEIYRQLHPNLHIVERGRFINAQAFCHDDKKPSLNINREKKVYYCHPCGEGSDIIGLVQQSLNESFLGALTWLDRHA